MYLIQKPVGEVAKDDGVPTLFVVIGDANVRELPKVLTPSLDSPVGGAKIKEKNLVT